MNSNIYTAKLRLIKPFQLDKMPAYIYDGNDYIYL
jgi:hypothetical protein